MCGKKELFSQLNESIRYDVNFRNKSKVSIMGKGNVKIHSKDGTDVTIADAFFVLDLFWNLSSMGQLIDKKWHIINISNGVFTLSDKNKKMNKSIGDKE